jgi:extracellular elastinolytic metalloproteinase
MTPPSPSRRRLRLVATGLVTATLVPGLAQLPALATTTAAPDTPSLRTIGDAVAGLADVDDRGTTEPPAERREAAAALGAVDLRWNAFGTPSSILPADGVLAPASSPDAAEAARDWIRDNAEVFGLTAAQVADLEVVNDEALAGSDAHAVLFRQRFGDLVPAIGSMVTVGVADGSIVYASSSITPTDGEAPTAELTPLEGWLAAARDVGRTGIEAGAIESALDEATGWTRLDVPGFAQEQQVRLRALAMADGRVRPVLEANVVDVQGGNATAYTSLVDAVTGEVLHRRNQVDNHQSAESFTGTFTATECGPRHAFELADDKTRTIVLAANALPVDDVTIKLRDPGGEVIFSHDLGTSPDAGAYTAERIPGGTYTAQVCPFDDAPPWSASTS